MKALNVYQNHQENIRVEVYPTLAGKALTEHSIIGLANGVTVNMFDQKIPENIEDEEFFGEVKRTGKSPAFVSWILDEEEGQTRICISQDIRVNIQTSDAIRNFWLNDAMYKALNGQRDFSIKTSRKKDRKGKRMRKRMRKYNK